MRKILATIVLAVMLTGCHHRVALSSAPPPPIETVPVNKWVINGVVEEAAYHPRWESYDRYNEEITVVRLLLPNNKFVMIAFPNKMLMDEFVKGRSVTVTFTGSYSRATLVSIE